MDRRRFLTTLGLTGAAAGLGLPTASRAAATSGAPKRLILLSHGHGWVYDGWKMRPGGLPDDQEWEADLTTLDASDSVALPVCSARRMLRTRFSDMSMATSS